MKQRSGKAISTTTNEYGSVSSIHGISYVLSKDIPWTDRLLWVVLVAASLIISGLLSWKSYANWKENPVITSLEDTSRSIKTMKYPAITICSEGLNMLAVDKVLQMEFESWQKNGNRRKREVGNANGKEQFLREKFQILSKDQKISNIIKTFFVKDVDEFVKTEGVRENLLACKKKEGKENAAGRRRKRSTAACEGEVLGTPVTCQGGWFKQNQDCECGQFGKVLKMVSNNDNAYEDRRWTITCQNIPQYQEAEEGYMQSGRHDNWEFSPMEINAFVKGLTSWFGDNDRTYQVKWSKNESFTVGDCGNWQKMFGANWNEDNIEVGPLAEDEVIGAVKSEYLPERFDRFFHVKVCKLSSQCK
jgi:hypothetical protein